MSFGSWNGVNDDQYMALATCTHQVQYHANPSTWNCTVFVNDSVGFNDTASDLDDISVNSLLAIGLPNTINYGTVNATYISNENITNVTNLGNVMINLSLSGYGFVENDGNAMNCTLGPAENISIEYEKFNLTSTTPGDLIHSQAIGNYTNLTSCLKITTKN